MNEPLRQPPILDGLGQMLQADRGAFFQIGNAAGQTQNAVIATGGKMQGVSGARQ